MSDLEISLNLDDSKLTADAVQAVYLGLASQLLGVSDPSSSSFTQGLSGELEGFRRALDDLAKSIETDDGVEKGKRALYFYQPFFL